MTSSGEEGRTPGRRAAAPIGRDVVLVVGLAAICVGGLAVFLRAAGAADTGVPVVPVATAVVLAIGVALAKWSVSPVRRRSAVGPVPAPVPDAAWDTGWEAEPLVPDVGPDALDHAAVDADGFEHTIAALCARDGCTPVEVVGGAGDLGADVIATTPDGRRIVLQCKHYADTNRVGSQDLQRFGGTCFAVHEADVAIVVTTSSFTAPAAEYAENCGILLVDAEALAAWTELAAPPPWEAASQQPASRLSAT
ncbi:restriction endonuclease [Streptomyces sp. NPDC058655]|uniref:restriction endonuclease n=1 Tax=Streptomyces sp. NPDC058655 TaxID=3346577 RepID=UPI003649D05B